MSSETTALIGTGLYTLREAAGITGVPSASIKRWLYGYKYRRDSGFREQPPIWQGDLGRIHGRTILSFLDLMEARFIHAFRGHRLRWVAIREAAKIACEMFEDQHPFTRGKFRTDGIRIFRQVEEGEKVRLFDLNRKSWVFKDIVEPSLYRGVEFSDDQISRWYPLFPHKSIVIDPEICFGRPLAARGYVPTDILAEAFETEEGNEAAVAKWYDVPVSAVRASVKFEALRKDRLHA